jgi:hypothetical protein
MLSPLSVDEMDKPDHEKWEKFKIYYLKTVRKLLNSFLICLKSFIAINCSKQSNKPFFIAKINSKQYKIIENEGNSAKKPMKTIRQIYCLFLKKMASIAYRGLEIFEFFNCANSFASLLCIINHNSSYIKDKDFDLFKIT